MTDLPLESILRLVRARTGWQLRDEDGVRLREKLTGRLGAVGAAPGDYLHWLESQPQSEEWDELLALLSNPETFFYRDSGQIALLRDRILPELVARRQAHRSLRIWSAGCSTGEEAYSLAFLLQGLVPDLATWDVLILGTDVSSQSLARAREGRYGEWSFRGRHPQLAQHFTREGDLWRVRDPLRRMVRFQTGNLVTDRFPDSGSEIRDMDLIVCRNVFIYFSRAAVAGVVEKMARTLRDGGYLLTGHSELHDVRLPPAPLHPRRFAGSLVYQLGAQERHSRHPTGQRALRQRAAPSSVARAVQPSARPRMTASPAPKDPVATAPAASHAVHANAERLLGEGRYRAALSEARERLAACPTDVRALTVGVRAAANTGDHDWASWACRRALEELPFAPEPYFLLAQIAEEQGQWSEAKELLKKSLYVAPQFVPAYLELASVYDRERNADRAAKLRASALELLKVLPADALVEGCEPAAAGELVAQLEGYLGRKARPL